MAGLTRPRLKVFIPVVILIAVFLAGFVSYYASARPDGLTKVAGEIVPSIAAEEQEHARGESTFAGYSTEGVQGDRLSGAIAGVAGVGITLAASGLLFFAIRRGGGPAKPDDRAGGPARQSSR